MDLRVMLNTEHDGVEYPASNAYQWSPQASHQPPPPEQVDSYVSPQPQLSEQTGSFDYDAFMGETPHLNYNDGYNPDDDLVYTGLNYWATHMPPLNSSGGADEPSSGASEESNGSDIEMENGGTEASREAPESPDSEMADDDGMICYGMVTNFSPVYCLVSYADSLDEASQKGCCSQKSEYDGHGNNIG